MTKCPICQEAQEKRENPLIHALRIFSAAQAIHPSRETDEKVKP